MAVTRAEVLDAYERAAHRFAEALRQAPPETPIPHLDWDVGTLGRHLLAVPRAYERALRTGEPVWSDLEQGPAENERLLGGIAERGNEEVADAIVAAAASLRSVAEAAGDTAIWSGGLHVPIDAVLCIQLGDFLVHGWDLAQVTHRPWSIEGVDVLRVVGGLIEVIPHFLTDAGRQFDGTFEIGLRGTGERVTFAFDGGTVDCHLGVGERPDCRVSADPEAFLLTAYGRLPVWKVAVTGKMFAYGRKPWLALRFTSLLRNP